MTSTHVPPITEEDIANYVVNTPGFFERHAELLATVQLVSPHGSRAVSLQERQAEMLREKIKGLEHRLMDMVRNSSENTEIAYKVHQWSAELLRVKEPAELPLAVVEGMRSLFEVPLATVRLWGLAPDYAAALFAQPTSEDARAFAASLTMPFCGPSLGLEPASWLQDELGVAPQSLALLPLRDGLPGASGASGTSGTVFGMLVLGSPDPQRFEATMGTDFLTRMAEVASAALSRLR